MDIKDLTDSNFVEKTPTIRIFCRRDICKRHTMKIGIAADTTSIMISKDPIALQNALCHFD